MKKKISDRTKHCRNMHGLFTALHLICLFGPFLYFIPYAFIVGETVNKVVVGLDIVICILLLLVALFIDQTNKQGMYKSVFWLLIAGVMFALSYVDKMTTLEVFIYLMAVVSILDELLIIRVKDYYKSALISNKEIDRRA